MAPERALIGAPAIGGQRKLVNVAQACAIVAVSRRTLYYWMARDLVEWCRVASGHRRIYADSLLKTSEDRA